MGHMTRETYSKWPDFFVVYLLVNGLNFSNHFDQFTFEASGFCQQKSPRNLNVSGRKSDDNLFRIKAKSLMTTKDVTYQLKKQTNNKKTAG